MAIIQSLPLGVTADISGAVRLVDDQFVEGIKTFNDGIISKITYNTPETSLDVDYYYGFNINNGKVKFYGKGETDGNCGCISANNSDNTNISILEVCSNGNNNSIAWNGLVKNSVIPFQNDYFNLGSTSNKWKNLYVTSINGKTPAYIDDIPSLAEYSTKLYVDTKVADLVNSAPETLDTLNELANALGNDPNFATTVTNQIGLKANNSDVVHKSGNETIAGVKTFSNAIVGDLTGTAAKATADADGNVIADTYVKLISINYATDADIENLFN